MCPNSPLVKKLVLIIALTILFPIVGWAQYSGHTFRFSANYACAYSPLDSILIENLTQGGTMTLYYPDTVASFVFTSMEAIDPAKRELQVSQNYPNPFSGETNIDVYLPEPDQVLIHVHDLAGRKVSEYVSFMDQGTHQFTFYACDQQAYLLTVSSNKHERKQIMIQVGKGNRSVARIVHNQMSSRPLTTMEVQDMPYNTGDELRFTGFVTDKGGEVVHSSYEETPDNSKDYLFDINNEVPEAPTEIYGETWVQGHSEAIIYQVEELLNVNYIWEVPESWELFEGQGTHAISASVGHQSGQVTVYAENTCGSSPLTMLDVSVFYPLTVIADPPELGVVSPTFAEVEAGKQVVVTATPNSEWVLFGGWEGDITENKPVVDIVIDKPMTITAIFNETNIIVTENLTRIDVSEAERMENIRGTFWDISGPFSYESDGEFYMFYPGSVSTGNINQANHTIHDIPPTPGLVLKRIDDKWEFFKADHELMLWGSRNYKITDDYVVICDGNELGEEWLGDAFYGEFQGGGHIEWTRVNTDDQRGFFHGIGAGDLTGNGLIDVGVAPAGPYAVKIFIQEEIGVFSHNESILNIDLNNSFPFTVEFADVTGDGRDEIITASFGYVFPEESNNISVYQYSGETKRYEHIFSSTEPNAFYPFDMGATTIKVHDFTNNGIMDISVAREDVTEDGRSVLSFEVWKGNGDGTFSAHWSSPFRYAEELSFREFWVLDVNNNGLQDIVLRPSGFSRLYYLTPVAYNPRLCGGIKLNHLIWLNNGDGTFSHYNREDLIIEGMVVDYIHPYMDGQELRFVGTIIKEDGMLWEENAVNLTAYDIRVRLITDSIPPILQINDVVNITSHSAHINSLLFNNGGALVTQRGIVWDTKEEPTIEDNLYVTHDVANMGEYTCIMEGLSKGTSYYVRAYAINDLGVGYSNQVVFTTPCDVPTVLSQGAKDITHEKAILTGFVNPNNTNVSVFFEYGLTTEYGQSIVAEQSPLEGEIDIHITAKIHNLVSDTTYYYKVIAKTESTVVVGEGSSFKTFYNSVTDLDGNTYHVIPIGDQEWMTENLKTTRYNNGDPIYYIDQDSYAWEENDRDAYAHISYRSVYGPDSDEEVKNNLGLLYNWYAVNTGKLCPLGFHVPSKEEMQQMLDFVSKSYGLSNTLPDTNPNSLGNALKSCCQINSPLGEECHTLINPRWEAHDIHFGNDLVGLSIIPSYRRHHPGFFDLRGTSAFLWSSSENPDDLAAKMELHYSSGNVNISVGHKNNGFTVRCIKNRIPTLETLQFNEVTYFSAQVESRVLATGGTHIIQKGVVWSEQESPTLENNQGVTIEGPGEQDYTSKLEGLDKETTYFVRAYATNAEGTGYGNHISFTTPDDLPVPRTMETSRITHEGAVLHGIVNPNLSIATISFEYGLTESFGHTVYAEPNLVEGSSEIRVSAVIYELDADSTYYYRLIAENNNGIAYGETKTFKTYAGSITDAEGNIYRTINLFGREWMAENLKVTWYNNGDSIPTGLNDHEWATAKQGAYAVYDYTRAGVNSQQEMLDNYGGLYNWHAVSDGRGLCPSGWQVPTQEEWLQLFEYLINGYGLHNDVHSEEIHGLGNALKSCRQINSPMGDECMTDEHPRWDSHGIHYGTDDFGVSIIPGGRRDNEGNFYSLGEIGYLWSTTGYSDINAWFLQLNENSGGVTVLRTHKTLGMNVRCIRDADK